MSDAPDDIKQIATRIAGNYMAFNVSCAAIYRDVAEALMAERAWCLKIVEERCEGDMDLAAFLIRRGSNDQA